MTDSVGTVLRDQGRGIVGALIVSIDLLFTMEMWWSGWQLPTAWLVVYSLVGLGVVLVITRAVGFRKDEAERRNGVRTVLTDFTELIFQSFVTAYTILLLFGVIDLTNPIVATRLGLLFVVPLGFGAALANTLLQQTDEEERTERPYYRQVGVFAVGAVFVAMTIAPTDEIWLLTAYAGWIRLALILLLSVLIAYLVLFELEFRGHRNRIADSTTEQQVGHAFVTYAVGLVVSVGLLAAFGQFSHSPISVWVQLTIVLGLPASIGASGARVVLA